MKELTRNQHTFSKTLLLSTFLAAVALLAGAGSAAAQHDYLDVERLFCKEGKCPWNHTDTDGTASVNLDTGRLHSRSVGAVGGADTDFAEIGMRFRSCKDTIANLRLTVHFSGLLVGYGGGNLNYGRVDIKGFLRDDTDGGVDVDAETRMERERGDPNHTVENNIGSTQHHFVLQGDIIAEHEYTVGLRLRTYADGVAFSNGEADIQVTMSEFHFSLNPGLEDTDGDGLWDVWETDGLLGCEDEMLVNLPEMGADPEHKDIFVELDWIEGSPPSAAQLALVKQAFAEAPIDAGGEDNPDGTKGINLWIDTGAGGFADDFGGGNEIEIASLPNGEDVPMLWGDSDDNGLPDFFEVKADNYDFDARRMVFRYALSGPSGSTEGDGTCSDDIDNDGDGNADSDDRDDCFSQGQATGAGNLFVPTNGAGLFMHELGHNLGLHHGGSGDTTNCKPNYVSVMSYSMTSGIPTDLNGDNVPDQTRLIDYSPPRFPNGRGQAPLPTVNEYGLTDSLVLDPTDNFNFFRFTTLGDVQITRALDEPADWNNDPTETTIPINVNSWSDSCDNGADEILEGNDDWSQVRIPFYADPITGEAPVNDNPVEEPTQAELDEIEEAFNTTDLSVTKVALGDLAVAGQIVEYEITVTNHGPNPASAPEILDTPPDDTFFVDPPEDCELVEPGGALRCPVDPLPVGESASLILQVRLPLEQRCQDEISTTVVNVVETLNRLSNGEVAPESNPDDNRAEVETDVLCLRYEYPAKVVCGTQPDPESLRFTRGRYATAVNVHNPNDEEVPFFEKLALAFPPVERGAGAVIPIGIDRLGYDEALRVDCEDLREELFEGSFEEGYIDGFVVIQSPRPLDVTAVYTTAQVDDTGAVLHSSIDVESVRERERPQPEPLPDLVVRNLRVEPRCYTPTACLMEVRYDVANVGDAVADAFTAHLTLEPGAAAVDTANFAAGLAPGDSVSGTYSGPVDFDAYQAADDLCVTADAPIAAVEEIDEENNRGCAPL